MVFFRGGWFLPLLLAAGAAGQASAQSGVVLYGNLDLGFVKESGSSARLDRGYNNWLGIKGEEDLGGGRSAIFNLQARFNPDTGQQERPLTFWQGESTVGLVSQDKGSIRLGRALSPLWHNVWEYEPWQNSGFNASLAAYQTGGYSSDGVNDGALGFADFSRISHGIFYNTPVMSGVTVHAATGLEKAPNATERVMGTSINYAGDALGAMLSYERNARKDEIFFVGAYRQFGPARIMASIAQNRRADIERERTFVLAGTYRIGANTVRAGYGRNRETGNHKVSLGYVHALSPRTSLYADLYRERTTANPDGRNDRNGMAVGISHAL